MNYKSNVRSVFVLGILFLIFSFEAISQFSFYKNYTVNDGLPSSKIYHMIQDSKGYIWFATENGVSRFDGYEFKNFTANDGLPTNSTLKIYEDYKGRIWFSSFTGQISHFENGEITEFPLNDELQELNVNFFDHIFVDSSDNIVLTAYNGGMFIVRQDKKFVELKKRYKWRAPRPYFIYLPKKTKCTVTGIIFPEDTTSMPELSPYEDGIIVRFYNDTRLVWFQKYCQKLKSDDVLVTLGPILKQINDSEVVLRKKYKNNIIALYEDWQNNVWVSEEFRGVYMYPGGDLNLKPKLFLKNKSVSKVLQDFDGNYWFSTTENGVYLVPSIAFKTYDEFLISENRVVLSIVTNRKDLFYSTINKGLYKVTIENDEFIPDKAFNLKEELITNISDLIISSDHSLWVSMSQNLKYDLNGNRKTFKSYRKKSGYCLIELKNSSVLMAHEYGYFKFNSKEFLYNSEDYGYSKKTLAILEGSDSTLWLGSLEGLYIYKRGKYSRFAQNDEVLNSRISDIKQHGDQILVGTFDNGLALISPDGVNYITEADGLNSNRIKVIYTDEDENFWVGTNKGLCQIILKNDDPTDLAIQKFTIWDGLPSNEINDILKIGDQIWLGTDNGLASFNPDLLQKSLVKPILQIENIMINDTLNIYLADITKMNSFENNITFSFKALSYKDPGNINYYYKLGGLENEWIETKSTSIRYRELAPSEYRFVIKAKNIDGIWSDESEFQFVIHKHFTQTAMFIILIVVLSLGVIAIIFWIILKNQKNRETLKQQVILAEQKAIRSQMNPHFLFNSLNSIQHLILNKEGKIANYYLANLSKLMRRILDNSKYTTVPLKDELENIKLYLDLEKFRFENHFDYSIEICDSIHLDEIVIPSMIIQPYIENAIWHGLVPKGIKGTLILSITRNVQKKLLIVIEDNGIGRKEADRIAKRRKNYKSMGMKNTKERIDLLNRLFNTHYGVEVIDLFNDKNQPQGTKIELTMDI